MTYPQNATAVVNISNNANGTVKVYIGETEIGNGAINNGHATIDLTRLAGGVHEVTVKFITNDDYNNNITTTAKFTVNRAVSSVLITQRGVDVIATVTTNATGNVTFIVNGKQHTVIINNNGQAIWENALSIGNNSVVAIYNGDVNYTSSNNNTNFTVGRNNSTVNVTATTVVYGNASEITVKVPNAQTGFVRIAVNGTDINVTVEINKGIARFNATGLNVGRYMVNVTYLGNEIYLPKSNITYFNITKANLKAEVIAQNVTVKENASFVITVISDFKGNVSITVDDNEYDGKVISLVEIARRAAGKYNATVRFYGDNNYNDKEINVTFTVSRVDPIINVTIVDVTYPAKAVANINISDYANGTVFITIGNKTFNKTIENGRVSIDLDGLSGGIKQAVVKFTTNDTFNNNASATTKFVVEKANTTIIISRNNLDVTAIVDAKATGYVTFIINGKEERVKIENGNATLAGALTIGNNYVTVIYEGDINFTTARNKTTFLGNKTNSTVNVTATSVVYGNASEITVIVPKAQTGFVRITVNGTDINVTVEIHDGIAKYNVSGLNAGKYTVNVTYLGSETYYSNVNSTTFNITKADLAASVIAQNVTVKDNIKFIIEVTDEFKGNVSIDINGKLYDAEALTYIELGKLLAGNKTATVTFYGDENYKVKELKVNFTVSKVTPTINVTINDVIYPNNATAVIKVSDNANGTVTITVDGKPFSQPLINGVAEVNIYGLNAGVKDAQIVFVSTDDYNSDANATYKFTINKTNSTININVPGGLHVGDSAFIDITVSCTGNVTIYVDGVEYTRTLNNNKVNVTVNNLAKGKHTIMVYYPGDVNYNANSASETFYVGIKESLVNVTVKDTTYSKPVTITVNVPVNQTGFVRILVDGKNYTEEIKDGKAIFTITGLKVSNYTVNVTYLGDENYTSNTNSTTFNVTKANLTAEVQGLDVTVNDDIKFIVNVTDDFKGSIKITIDDVVYDGDVKSLIIGGKLKAGTYTANATFYGDENYNVKEIPVTFTVSRVAGEMTVVITDATYPNAASAHVTITNNANGTVYITVDGKKYNGTMRNGVADITLDGLNASGKVADVKFVSTDNYTADMNTTSRFIIYKASSSITLTNSESGITATITAPGTVGGYVTFYVNGVKYADRPVSNTGVATLSGLPVGNNSVVAVFQGDINHNGSDSSEYHIVPKVDSNIYELNVTNIREGDIETIDVAIHATVNGSVIIKVDNISYYVNFINGTAHFNVTGLKEGLHTVNVTYLGTNYYNPSYAYANFTVGAIKLNVTGTGNETVVNVTITDNSSGNITLLINGTPYNATVINGTALVNLTDIAPGIHDVTVIYVDNNGTESVINTTVDVPKWESDVNVTMGEIIEGIDTTVTITVEPQNATGKVLVEIDGTGYIINLTNGSAEIPITGLDEGNHTITVTYLGDERYEASNKTIEFTVKEKITTEINKTDNGTFVVVDVPGNATGGNVTIVIDGQNYTANVTDGKAVVNITNATPGVHDVIVIYNDGNNTEHRYNTTLDVPKWDSDVNVTITNPIEGVDTVITVDVTPANATGIVLVDVDGVGYYVNITNGTGNLTVKDLTAGNHTVTVIYQGDDMFNTTTVVKEFVVEPAIDVEVFNNGTETLANVTVPGNATGNVTIIIDNVRYNATVVNGTALVNITNATPGTHEVTVIYVDNNGTESKFNTTIEVPKFESDVNVTITNPIEGVDTVLTLEVTPINATGIVLVDVDGVGYNENLTNGTGNLTVKDLTAGNHTVTVIYQGDDMFNTTTVVKEFVVEPAIDVEVFNNGTETFANVTVPGNATGNVTIIIDNVRYNTTVVNGTALVNITNATPGTHEVTVIYVDNNGTESKFNTTIVVPKFESDVNVTITNPIEGVDTVITVEVTPINATGIVLVDVDGVGYYVNITNGTGNITVKDLAAGNHTVTVIYQGDDMFNTTTVVKEFVVEPAIDVEVFNNGTETFANVTVPGNATGNVTIIIDNVKYNATVVNGTALVNITNATPGTHEVTVIYVDNNGTESKFNTTIVVPKFESDVNVTITNPIEGVDTVITVEVTPINATGIVLVDVDGVGYYVNITNGTGNITVKDLAAGNHTVTVIYQGDENYNTTKVVKEFVVEPAIDVEVFNNGTETFANVTVPGNATAGNVTIIIDGVKYNGTVENGTALINITGKEPGIYNATVIYVDGNGTESQFDTQLEVPKFDSEVNVTVGNSIEGLGTTITIKVTPENATGIALIDIDGTGYYVNLTNGTGSITVKDLKAGNHTVTVTYAGDDKYNSSTTKQNFTVKEGIDIKVNGTGNGTIIKVDVPGNETAGNVTIIINKTNYTAPVINGTAIINLTNVTPGTHNATIIYVDGNNNTSEINTTITLPKWDAEVDVNVTQAIEGLDTIIEISVNPVNATGIVLVDVDGVGYYANVTDGTAKVVIKDLGKGTHNATVKFTGSEYYNDVVKTVEFTVEEGIEIKVNGTGNDTVVEVVVPGNATGGNITIVINGTNYTGDIINGTAIINLTNVTPGTHNATIIYVDGNNNTSKINTTITLPKWDADIDVAVKEGIEGLETVITVKVSPDNVTGVVLIDVDGKGYYANITNGTATLALNDLGAGNHTAVVKFPGNDMYNEVTEKVNFTVKEAIKVDGDGNSSIIKIDVPGNATGGNVTVVINGTNYTADVVNGTAIINLTNVTPGTHNATIIYVDGNNNTSKVNTTISLPKWDAKVNATAIDIAEGFDEVITINVSPINATGVVLVDIDGKGYYANITNGTAKLSISGLKKGQYTAYVRYAGDDYYNEANTTVEFTVGAPITVDVNDNGNSSVIEVHVPGNATGGNVTVVINGTNYTADVVNGTAVINMTNVTPGTHNATIIYVDGNNNTSEFNTTISIPKVDAPISASVDNSTEGKVKVTVDVPEDATGYVIVNVGGKDYGINLTDGNKSVTIPITSTGDYTAVVTYLGDDKYKSNSTTSNFHATGANSNDSSVSVEVKDTPIGEDVEVKVTVPEGSSGTATVTVDNTTKTVDVGSGENIIKVPGVSEGSHNVTVTYTDKETGETKTFNKTIRVFNSINAEKEMKRGWNSPYDYKAEFLDNEGHILANTTVQFIVNGKTYNVKTDSQGIAYLDADLAIGKYDVTIINPVTGANETATTTIVKRLIENKDITLDFDDGTCYVVRAIGDDGQPVGAGEVVGFRVNGVDYIGITDSKGYAKLRINLNPTKYTITAQYSAYKVNNKIVVKQTMKLVKKTVKVKKGKKIVLKAKVKLSNGKAVKGKLIKFKFKGKIYKAKTNKKGIAKVTIKKKSVLKKLKKGKKYTYIAIYYKNKLKGTVKIK
ncbi:beta strand repeat-containing protein [Methanobrevibacter sp.]